MNDLAIIGVMLLLVGALGYVLVVAVRMEQIAELVQDEDKLDLIAATHNANAYASRNQLFDRLPNSTSEYTEETEDYDEWPFALDHSPRKAS